MVEAKADDYKAACEDVEFYAQNNNIDKDIVDIAIAGQSKLLHQAGLFFLLNGKYQEIPTDGKLLPIKDIIKIYRKEKYGHLIISTDSLKNTIKQLNKDFFEDIEKYKKEELEALLTIK